MCVIDLFGLKKASYCLSSEWRNSYRLEWTEKTVSLQEVIFEGRRRPYAILKHTGSKSMQPKIKR